MAKIKAIFFTENHWDTFGGVPGATMTISEHVSSLEMFGPSGLAQLVKAQRFFFFKYERWEVG
jgi:ribonuclease BN (tRNA processing enzyme)